MLPDKYDSLHNFITSCPVPVFYKNKEKKYLFFNDLFLSYLDKSRDEIIGKTVYDLFPLTDAQVYDEKDSLLINDEDEDLLFYKHSEIVAGMNKSYLFFKKRLNMASEAGILGIIFELNNEKLNNNNLSFKPDDYFFNIIDSISDFIIIIDKSGYILDVNKSVNKVVGQSLPAREGGYKVEYLMPTFSLDKRESLQISCLRSALSSKVCVEVEVSSYPFAWKGKEAYLLLGKSIDKTNFEQVLVENIRDLIVKVSEEDSLEEGLDKINDFLLNTLSVDACLFFISDNSDSYRLAKSRGINPGELKFFKEFPSLLIDIYKSREKEEVFQVYAKEFFLSFLGKNGFIDVLINDVSLGKKNLGFFVLFSNRRLFEHREFYFSKLFAQQIASIIHLIFKTQEVIKQQEKLLDSHRAVAIGDVSYNLVKELSVPMRKILGKAQLLEEKIKLKFDDSNNVLRYLNDIVDVSRNVVMGFNDILSIPRNNKERSQSWIKASEIINNSYGLVIQKAKILGIELDVLLVVPENTEVFCSGVDLSKVLNSLVQNAIEGFNNYDILFKWIRIQVEQNEEGLLFRVINNGPSLPTFVQDIIFNDFFSPYDGDRKSGLGLSVAKMVIEKQQGKLILQFSNQETSFAVIFPKCLVR